jgi:hypothetical protein
LEALGKREAWMRGSSLEYHMYRTGAEMKKFMQKKFRFRWMLNYFFSMTQWDRKYIFDK